MKFISTYLFCAGVITTLSQIAHSKKVVDLKIEFSGTSLPVVNDHLYRFYVKDYYGLVNGYAAKTDEIKTQMNQDYTRWTGDLKSHTKGLEVLKSAYTKIVDEMIAFQNVVLAKYQEISPIGIGGVVKSVNHMRDAEREFYAKVKVHTPKCHDLVDRNLYYAWEKPGLNCSNKGIAQTLSNQLQYTYDINVFYARFVDHFNMLADIPDEHKHDFVTSYETKVKEELLGYQKWHVDAIERLLKDVQACSEGSYGVFENFKKSIYQQASECF